MTETDGEGFLPLDCAASNGCEDLTALLVKAQQDVPLSRAQLDKALLLCASEGNFNEKVASGLLEAGASVNCSDAEGYSPLMHAAELGDARAVLFLADHGADKGIRNAEGATALDVAKRSGRHKIIELLQGQPQN